MKDTQVTYTPLYGGLVLIGVDRAQQDVDRPRIVFMFQQHTNRIAIEDLEAGFAHSPKCRRMV